MGGFSVAGVDNDSGSRILLFQIVSAERFTPMTCSRI